MKHDFLRLVDVSDQRDGVLWVDHLHLRIPLGSAITILGVEGSGKTSVGYLLAGKREPTGGRILWEEKSIGTDELQKITGYIGRQSRLLPNLSVWENLLVANSQSHVMFPIKTLKAQVHKLLCEFAMERWLMVPVTQIPASVQRQLLMLRAVLNGKKLIILSGGGRQETEAELAPILRVIQRLASRGISMLYTTDRLDLIASALDEIVIMRNGTNVKRFLRGTWNEVALEYLYAQPIQHSVQPPYATLYETQPMLQDRLFSVYGGSVVHIYNTENTNDTVFSYLNSLCQLWRVPAPVVLGTEEVNSGWIASMNVLDNMLLAAAPKLANTLGHVGVGKKKMLRQECEHAVQVSSEIWNRRPYQLTREERLRLQLFRYRLRGIRVIIANFNELDESDQAILLRCADSFLDKTCAMICVAAGAQEGWIWNNGMIQGGWGAYEDSKL